MGSKIGVLLLQHVSRLKQQSNQEEVNLKRVLPETDSVCIKLVAVRRKLSKVEGFDLAMPSANVGG